MRDNIGRDAPNGLPVIAERRDLAVCIPPDGRLQASSEIAAAGSLAGPDGGVAEIDKVLALHAQEDGADAWSRRRGRNFP